VTSIGLTEPQPHFWVDQLDSGDVLLGVKAAGTTIQFTIGRIFDDVSLLAESLRHLAEDVDRDILTGWEDTPEDDDGYISFDRGRYHILLDGRWVGDYPAREVAEIELARAMVTGGVFPNTWYVNERGIHEPIGEQISRWHNEAGNALIPLPGVQYQPGDRVWYGEPDWPYVVIGDWGETAGLEIHTAGDPSIHTHITDRSQLRPVTD